MGKFVGGIGCVCGILIMVIPISIFSNNFELIFAAHQQRLLQKKEHVATEDLRELLTGDVPLYQQIIDARKERGEDIPAEVMKIINASADANTNNSVIRAGRDGIVVAGAVTSIGKIKRTNALGLGSRPLRYSTIEKEHVLEPYHSFLDRLIDSCHRKIDSERESLRKHVAKIHRVHRTHLLMNVEDLWANWFAVPVGQLVESSGVQFSPSK